MDILVCPVCKGKLELKVDKEEGGEIVSGGLFCPCCKVHYPINEGIPVLLPPETRN
jgi:uncharacterized protein YbaR (Trm112 family)